MNAILKYLILAAIIVFPFLGVSQTAYEIKSHEITIEGTSNLLSWTASVEEASGNFEISLEEDKIDGINNVNVRIDATSIKGSEGRRMDAKIYESLKTDTHPNIDFVLRDILSLAENPGTARVSANGVLTIAGVSRLIELKTVGKVSPGGELEFTGTHSIKMTDFNIKPPTAMFGALRTGDEITFSYRVVLRVHSAMVGL